MAFEYLSAGFDALRALAYPADLISVATSGNPVALSGLLFAALVAYCFLGGVITNTHSFVDQLWSLAPIGYAWIFAWYSGGNPRVLLMAVIITAWGLRLTFNFARKGGYNGVEDYRWEVVRRDLITNRIAFELFNLTYISTFQHVIIFLFTAPIAYVWYYSQSVPFAWTTVDIVSAVAAVFFLVFETVADQQQWEFQCAKRDPKLRVPALADDYARGFLTHGLFAYSRHPNFFGEQSFWVSIAGFTLAVGPVLNVGLLGAAVLIANFLMSAPFGEGISAAKYKDYPQYQRLVSRQLPWFPATLKKSE